MVQAAFVVVDEHARSVVLFHPRDGDLNDEPLSEEAHPGIIDLLYDDVVTSIESGTNLTKVVWIGVRCLMTVALPE